LPEPEEIEGPPAGSPRRAAFDRLQAEIDHCCEDRKLVPKT